VEQVGTYNPVTKEKTLNKERVQYWLSQGVQPSPTLHNLFIKDGILEGKKIPKHKKSKKPAEVKPVEAKPQPKEEKTAEAPKPEESSKPAEKVIEAGPQSTETPKTE